jgi:hypothetical protein
MKEDRKGTSTYAKTIDFTRWKYWRRKDITD